ncbi:MAG: phosphatidylethanolamine-binding protein [Monoraphidium minutum]|nr:MAG: phosphatidylethanolamine-binding protein [Monoraphidium minutum]
MVLYQRVGGPQRQAAAQLPLALAAAAVLLLVTVFGRRLLPGGAPRAAAPPLSDGGRAALVDAAGCNASQLVGGAALRVQLAGGKAPLAEGAVIKPSEAAAQPAVTVTAPGLYSLVLVDPDAPAPDNPSARSWLHWMLVNCKAPAAGAGACQELTPYAPPTPPKGRHRYVLLVYLQPGGAAVTAAAPAQRAKFSAHDWSEGLWGAGATPAALTYFEAAPEAPRRRG